MSTQVKRATSGLLAAVGVITVLTVVSRIIGFLRWIAQSAWVGSADVAGAYATANQIPNVIMEVLAGGALAGAVVPLLSLPLAKKMRSQVNEIAGALLTWALAILLPAALLLIVTAPALARLLPLPVGAPAAQTYELLTVFLRIFAWQIPLYGISVVLTGILQAHKKFFWPALAPALSSLVVIATYALYGSLYDHRSLHFPASYVVQILGWGTTLGVAALSLPLFYPVLKLGVRMRLTFRFPPGEGKHALRLASAGIASLLAQQLAVIVVLTLARSYGEAGTVAIYQYTTAVYMLPYAVLVTPLVTALYPHLSEHGGSCEDCPQVVSNGHRLVWIAALGSVVLLVVGAPWAQAFFSHLTQVPGMCHALWGLAPGLGAFALLLYYTRVLYAFDHSHYALWANAAGWTMVAAGSALCAWWLWPGQSPGATTLLALGLGNSAGMLLAACLAAVFVSRVFGKALWANLGQISLLVVGCVAGTALALVFTDYVLATWQGSILLIFCGAVVAVALAGAVFGGAYLVGQKVRR